MVEGGVDRDWLSAIVGVCEIAYQRSGDISRGRNIRNSKDKLIQQSDFHTTTGLFHDDDDHPVVLLRSASDR